MVTGCERYAGLGTTVIVVEVGQGGDDLRQRRRAGQQARGFEEGGSNRVSAGCKRCNAVSGRACDVGGELNGLSVEPKHNDISSRRGLTAVSEVHGEDDGVEGGRGVEAGRKGESACGGRDG